MSLILLLVLAAVVGAQTATIQPTGVAEIPTLVDGNSPSFWLGDQFRFLTSTGADPVMLTGGDHYTLSGPRAIKVAPTDHYPIWIEAVWVDEDGTVFGWYHHEPGGLCGASDMTAPQIGAVVSADDGETWTDLGIVMIAGDPLDCRSGNQLFAGGNGDFSVILDQHGQYFYFLFTNYGGGVTDQGVAIARLAYTDRWNPAGNVFKYYGGGWYEPGIGGAVTPVFPAARSWAEADTDSFWGPSIHWNTYLGQYVVLMNRSCCRPRWPQEGIYVTFSRELSEPSSWTRPQRIVAGGDIKWRAGYYPQVIGEWPDGTDRQAGQDARLYIHGKSRWLLHFEKESAPVEEPEPVDR